jgi:hypothetical protein
MAGMKLRFSIREIILVTIIVAMALGWWLDHRQAIAYKHKAELVWARSNWPPRGYVRTIDQAYESLSDTEADGPPSRGP